MSFDGKELEKIKEKTEIWENEYKNTPKREVKFTTVSGMDVRPLATPDSLEDFDYLRDLGLPGSYPFTRGTRGDGRGGGAGGADARGGAVRALEGERRFKFLLE